MLLGRSSLFVSCLLTFLSILCTDLIEAKSLPTLQSIQQKRDNQECFYLFCDVFLSKVVGVTTWRDGCIKLKVSDMATASDEAFTYLLIENYWDNWATLDLETYKNETTYENNSTKKKKRKATWGKYTKNAYGARRFGGWTDEGRLRFNSLYAEVTADRLKNGGRIEELYLSHCVETMTTPKKEREPYNCNIVAVWEDITDLI